MGHDVQVRDAPHDVDGPRQPLPPGEGLHGEHRVEQPLEQGAVEPRVDLRREVGRTRC